MTENKIWTLAELEEIRQKANCECWKKIGHGCILGKLEYYKHDGGEFIEGIKEKQWVYFTCNRCHYQWSLSKILCRIKLGELPE